MKTEYLVVFTKNLQAVKFLDLDGNPVDPRIILSMLASGVVQVVYSQETISLEDMPQRVKSQTWKIVERHPLIYEEGRKLSPWAQDIFDKYPDMKSLY